MPHSTGMYFAQMYMANGLTTARIVSSKAIGAVGSRQSTSGFGRQNKGNLYFTKVQISPIQEMTGRECSQYNCTHLPVPLHTSFSHLSRPHELVACIVPDPSGGESILLPLKTLLKQLNCEIVQVLRDPVYL